MEGQRKGTKTLNFEGLRNCFFAPEAGVTGIIFWSEVQMPEENVGVPS